MYVCMCVCVCVCVCVLDTHSILKAVMAFENDAPTLYSPICLAMLRYLKPPLCTRVCVGVGCMHIGHVIFV